MNKDNITTVSPPVTPPPTLTDVGVATLPPSTPPPALLDSNAAAEPPKTPPNVAEKKPPSTPYMNKLFGYVPYASNTVGWNADEIKIKLFHESKRAFVGHMPTNAFMETFLPWQNGRTEFPITAPYFPVYDGGLEKVLYKPFIKATDKLGLNTLQFVDTHLSSDKNSLFSGIKPDMSIYKKGGKAKGTEFSTMEFWIEFKTEFDPFKNVTNLDHVCSTNEQKGPSQAEQVIGQLIAYAVAHMGSGFFTHTFSVFAFGNYARLIRWDRAGAVVTEPFDYVNTPILVEFFQRFDQLTPEQRGRDMTVRDPSVLDRTAAARALEPKLERGESKEHFERRKEGFDPDNFLEYLVTDSRADAGVEPRRFIGPPPARPPLSLHGRTSRGCPVYDVQEKRVCYLKDTWRVDSPLLREEGKTYDILQEKNVPHIARAVAHGNVTSPRVPNDPTPAQMASIPLEFRESATANSVTLPDTLPKHDTMNLHVTKSDKFINEPWCTLKQPMQGYIHYRLVLDVVGRDLTAFESTRELLVATCDALKAHGHAFQDAGVLHRDISPGNIMITSDGRGFLIDWDLAKDASCNPARSLGRTGTWQFISGALLQDPETKIHEYSDDLESFLHALTFVLLRFTKTNWDAAELRVRIEEMYDSFRARGNSETSYFVGGRFKVLELCRGSYIPVRLKFVGRDSLRGGLAGIASLFMDLYLLDDTEALEKRVREARERLNEFRKGGLTFKSKLEELIQSSGKWVDAPAELVTIPPSSKRVELHNYLAKMQARTSYQTSEIFAHCTDSPGETPVDADAPKAKRRRLHDAPEAA